MATLELHWHLSDAFQERLGHEYPLDNDDIALINAVCEKWGEEEMGGQTLAEARADLERRVLAALKAAL